MPAAIGFTSQKAARIDRDSILIGSVLAGLNSSTGDLEPASVRTGVARLLEGRLNPYDSWKIVGVGGQAVSAGGYIFQAAHVAQGDVLANASAWATIGAFQFNGLSSVELAFSGTQVEGLVKAAASPAISGKIRVTAIRLRPGSGNLAISNVALASNVATITFPAAHNLLPGDVVTVNCSNTLLNGTFAITAVTTTSPHTISYASAQSNITSASATGTVTNGVAVPSGNNNMVYLQRT